MKRTSDSHEGVLDLAVGVDDDLAETLRFLREGKTVHGTPLSLPEPRGKLLGRCSTVVTLLTTGSRRGKSTGA